MRWEELPLKIDAMAALTEGPARAIKLAVADVFTIIPVGYFFQPDTGVVALQGRFTRGELARCKEAAARAVGTSSVRRDPLDTDRASCGEWIKVAYSPSVRRLAESLNFFPGTYPGGIPNHPSPLAAMLTSALVGGGLGYGLGWLGEKVLPQGYGKKLKRTGLLLGALAGAAPGAAWGLANHRTEHSLRDSWPFTESHTPTDSPVDAQPDNFSTHQPSDIPHEVKFQEHGLTPPREKYPVPEDPALPYRGLKLGSFYTQAAANFLKRADLGDYGAGYVDRQGPTPYDVHIDHLGQTLWETGASAPLLGATLGTLYAAQRMPDPEARNGWATGNQLGQLAMNAGKDYLTGRVLGALINAAVGTPYSAPTFGLGSAALGLVRAGVQNFLGV